MQNIPAPKQWKSPDLTDTSSCSRGPGRGRGSRAARLVGAEPSGLSLHRVSSSPATRCPVAGRRRLGHWDHLQWGHFSNFYFGKNTNGDIDKMGSFHLIMILVSGEGEPVSVALLWSEDVLPPEQQGGRPALRPGAPPNSHLLGCPTRPRGAGFGGGRLPPAGLGL